MGIDFLENGLIINLSSFEEVLWAVGWRGAILLALVLGVFYCLNVERPIIRHRLLAAGFVALLSLPVLLLFLPNLELKVLPGSNEFSTASELQGIHELLGAQGTDGFATRELHSLGLMANPTASRIEGRRNWSWAGVGLFVWALGVGLLLIRSAIGYLAIRKLRSGPRAHTELLADDLISGFCRELEISRPIPVTVSGKSLVPMTVGVLKPGIILPSEVHRWGTEKKRSVLLHELAHVKRRDLLIQMLATLACSLYWFNPLVWLARQKLRMESERSCDALVLGKGISPSEYARYLLQVARQYQISGQSGVMVTMVKESQLEKRINTVLGFRGMEQSSVLKAAFLVGILTVLVSSLAALRLVPGEVSASSQVVRAEPGTPPSPLAAPNPAPTPPRPLSATPPPPPESAPGRQPQAAPEPPGVPVPEGSTIKVNAGDHGITVDLEGVEVLPDFSAVSSIEPGGYLIATQVEGSVTSRIELRPGSTGITRDYLVNGESVGWNQDSEQLLDRALHALKELKQAEAELERVREVEIPQLRDELAQLKEIDLEMIRQEIEQARAELEQSLKEINVELSEEKMREIQERIREGEKRISGLSQEKIEQRLLEIKEKLPEKIELHMERIKGELEKLKTKLKELKVADPGTV